MFIHDGVLYTSRVIEPPETQITFWQSATQTRVVIAK